MERRQLLIALMSVPLFAPLLSGARTLDRQREPIVGLPCEGCDAVFIGIPEALSCRARIAPQAEPGNPLTLTGRVVDQAGRPQEGVIVYAYHTNDAGIYPPTSVNAGEDPVFHGSLRGWVETNASGEYWFDTIRPGSYPGRDLPEHIHMHVIEPGRATYYIDDVMFLDDPKLTAQQVRQLTVGRGGLGITSPGRADGVWLVRRDIMLGLNVPGYPP